MNRADGLIQRRNIIRENSEGVPKDSQTLDKKHDRDEDVDDVDSKETRLTLMEEVLLLGLKDKEVRCYHHKKKLRMLSYAHRATHLFGTIAFQAVCVDAF